MSFHCSAAPRSGSIVQLHIHTIPDRTTHWLAVNHAIHTFINHAFDIVHTSRLHSPQEGVYTLYIEPQYGVQVDIVHFACE
jgi:hypothetical protein